MDIVITLDIATSAPDISPHKIVVRAYPNPNKRQFYVEYAGERTVDLNIDIVDITGKIVTQRQIKGILKHREFFNIEAQHKGIYFIMVNDGSKRKTIKMIIN